VNAALVALVVAAPVVKLGAGSGVVLDDGVLVTTRQVALRSASSKVPLEDGGTLALIRSYDVESEVSIVLFSGDVEQATLDPALPDAGSALTVVTPDGRYDALAMAPIPGGFGITIADAGVVEGAAIVDEAGRVRGLVRNDHEATSAAELVRIMDSLKAPDRGRDFARWRNLGISAVFFLGLCVWWVYRSKRLRY
jgi:hypothetical protein